MQLKQIPYKYKPKDSSINLKHTVNGRHFYLRCEMSFHSVVKKADWTIYSSFYVHLDLLKITEPA